MTATALENVYPHIAKNREVCSGRACVAGTRVRVMDIASLHNAGVSPEDIVREFPSLHSAIDVYGTFASSPTSTSHPGPMRALLPMA